MKLYITSNLGLHLLASLLHSIYSGHVCRILRGMATLCDYAAVRFRSAELDASFLPSTCPIKRFPVCIALACRRVLHGCSHSASKGETNLSLWDHSIELFRAIRCRYPCQRSRVCVCSAAYTPYNVRKTAGRLRAIHGLQWKNLLPQVGEAIHKTGNLPFSRTDLTVPPSYPATNLHGHHRTTSHGTRHHPRADVRAHRDITRVDRAVAGMDTICYECTDKP